jgi:membrane protease YdiL (CAAX protease family)
MYGHAHLKSEQEIATMFRNLTDLTKALIFFVLAFGMTLAVSLLQPLLGEATMLLHMFTPTLAGVLMMLVVTRDGYTKAAWRALGLHRAGLRWWGFALLGPLVLMAGVYAIVWLIGVGNPAMPEGFTPVALLLEIVASLVISTLFAIGEEIGFRGYLLPRLMHLGTGRALVLAGLMFGSWHFPLMLLTPVYPILGSWLFVGPIILVTLAAAGVFYGSLRLSSDSVWPSTLAHGAINSSFKLFGMITVTASPVLLEYLVTERGVITMIATVLSAIWLISRLQRRRSSLVVQQASGA